MDTFVIVMFIIVLISTHGIAYNIGKIVELKKYGKKLDLLKEEMDEIKSIKKGDLQ